MQRVLNLSLACLLLTGCATFNASHRETSDAEWPDLQSGRWCRVMMSAEGNPYSKRQTEYVGRIQQMDDDSVTITDVTISTVAWSPMMTRVPYLSRLYKNTGPDVSEEGLAPLRLQRSNIQRINPISAEQAAEFKKPIERIGIDFDYRTDPLGCFPATQIEGR